MIHVLGQILFGGYFLYNGINHFINYKGLSGYAASKKVPAPVLATLGTGVLLSLGGLGVLLNVNMFMSLALLALFLLPTSLIMHAFWKETDPGARSNQKIAFMKNIALLGAVLMMMY